ncbi:MAG: PHP domain-containing protein [Lachnospiraceae bacterium]|nr:PHP domain-containing protein [Ruminococcus sp.]MCM1275572.1 PHP domain-containing protein [Lachnospiraceae bacterium]
MVKNQAGLKNLYKLVSLSYSEKYFFRKLLVFLSELQKHLSGLIIGSGSEFFRRCFGRNVRGNYR